MKELNEINELIEKVEKEQESMKKKLVEQKVKLDKIASLQDLHKKAIDLISEKVKK